MDFNNANYGFLLLFELINSTGDYLEYKSVVTSYTRHNSPYKMQFPALTICNLDQNLTIQDMLLYGKYDDEITYLDFYEMSNKTRRYFRGLKCYSINIGKDANGNQTKIEQASFF